MAFRKKEIKYHYITDGDRKRLAQAEQSDAAKARKFKAHVILEKPGLSQDILIYVYGESKDEVKLRVAEHVKFFKDKDPAWKIKETKLLRGEGVQSEEAQSESQLEAEQ